MSLIELKNVNKYYISDDSRQQVLKNISLKIESGDMVSIMGPSGSGKTTLLNILGLLDQQSDGEYRIDNVNTANAKENDRAYLRNEKIGFVFQSFNLIKELSALENVQMSLRLSNLHKKGGSKLGTNQIKLQSIKILESLGLKDHMSKKPSQLSGGQQQRVAIARALVNNPKIILADEPTGALDQTTSKDIMKILSDLHEEGKTIIIITHDNNIAKYCKNHLFLLDGQLVGHINHSA